MSLPGETVIRRKETVPSNLSPPTAATPEFKTCPGCAEEVRFAARKCRFCGYMFVESAEVSG